MKYFLYTLLATLAIAPHARAEGYSPNKEQTVIVDDGDGKAAAQVVGKGIPVVIVTKGDANMPSGAKSGIADGKYRIINTSSTQGLGASLIVDQPPYEWLACTADEDCIATNFACEDIAVNKAHEHSFDETAAQMGFRIDPSVCKKRASASQNAPAVKCLKDASTSFLGASSSTKRPPRCVIARSGGVGIQIKTSPPILP